ncbi:MAG TPA: lysophospholipid transporter LplT [Gammaproteobacteria bacterium]|nr:lysophospholipid transporter LplT [Gammaproteobacteria bacterium]
MNRHVHILLSTQFLTAFADNALLFTAVAMAMHQPHPNAWYLPAIQAAFLVAYVLMAPWVGPYADSRPKASVLTSANVVKAAGAVMMLAGIDPLIAYAVVGMGAAVYAPAKYGILPELVSSDELVRANSWIEGSTILAILAGSVAGGKIADASIPLALVTVLALYVASGLAALFIRRTAPTLTEWPPVLSNFKRLTTTLLADSKARLATFGVSLFWGSAAVLRVVLAAWAPLVLGMHDSADVAVLMVYVAIGVALGAVAAPRIIPLAYLRRARLAAYAMGACVVVLGNAHGIETTRAALVLVGLFGGLFMVPMNAALQDIGHRSIGSGAVISVQHFFENLAMVVGTALYSVAAAAGASPVGALVALGALVVTVTLAVSLHLPRLAPLPELAEPVEEGES